MRIFGFAILRLVGEDICVAILALAVEDISMQFRKIFGTDENICLATLELAE